MVGSRAFSSLEIVDGSWGDHQGFSEVTGGKCLPGRYWCSTFIFSALMNVLISEENAKFLSDKRMCFKDRGEMPCQNVVYIQSSSAFRLLAGWWPSLADGSKVRGWRLHWAWKLDVPVYPPLGWRYPGPGWLQALQPVILYMPSCI